MSLSVANGRMQNQSSSSLPDDTTENGVIGERSDSDGSSAGGDDSIERGDKTGASSSVKNARAEGERYFADALKASLQAKVLASNPAKNGNADVSGASSVKAVSASGKNGTSEKTAFYVLIPKDRETVSDYNLLFASAQAFYEKEGIKVSNAAIEEAVGQGRIFEKREFKPDFVRDESGSPILDAEGNPQRAYLITIDDDAKRALLEFRPEAERITREAIPAVHDLTDKEREYLVLKIFAEKYAKELPKETLNEVFSFENFGQVALGKVLDAASAGVGGMLGAATFTVVGAPELHFILKDIKRFTYAPTKPSDLDAAAKRLADLTRMYAVSKITSKIDRGADRLSEAADKQIPKITNIFKTPPPGFGSTAPALAPAGGPPINWRMPIDKPMIPALPDGSLRPSNESPRGWIGGTGSKGEPNEAGGPLNKPEPLRASIERTAPSNVSNKNSVPRGKSTRVNSKESPENIRALNKENESAIAIAQAGYDIEQNPFVPGAKNPDYKIEGKIFDCYAPGEKTNVRNIVDRIDEKIGKGQSDRIVLNLDGSSITLDEIRKELIEKPVPGLKEIIIVKDGNVMPFFPYKP